MQLDLHGSRTLVCNILFNKISIVSYYFSFGDGRRFRKRKTMKLISLIGINQTVVVISHSYCVVP